MSVTLATMYPRSVAAALNGSGPLADLIRLLGKAITLPEGASAGAITVPIVSAFTAAANTDGTVLTNGYNNTTANMTLVDNVTTLSRTKKVFENLIYNADSLETIINSMADALRWEALDTSIEALAAATPTTVETLQSGHMNFTSCDATDIGDLMKAIIGVSSRRSGSLADMAIMIYPAAFANLTVGLAASINNPGRIREDGTWTLMGIPIYPVAADSATNWGAASKSCAFVVHPEGYALKFTEPYLHGGGPIYASDGTVKLILQAPYAYGVIQAGLIGEVANTTS